MVASLSALPYPHPLMLLAELWVLLLFHSLPIVDTVIAARSGPTRTAMWTAHKSHSQ